MNYQEFIERKQQQGCDHGFEPLWLHDGLFDFQKALVEWALRKGRVAVFADCGLGKTIIQLVWAENVVRKTNGRVLILTPLAVTSQTVREGEKFGIEAAVCRDGKLKDRGKIIVTNYERLHYFKPGDFVGVVCDECFPPDTPIEVFDIDGSIQNKCIKELSSGDKIRNAYGEDYVQETYKRSINRAVHIRVGGRGITCSENHPFFTLYGWRCAQDLQPGDILLSTETAVCLVRGDIPSQIWEKNAQILREILFSEMEDEYTRTQGKGSYSRSSCKEREEEACLADERQPESKKRNRANTQFESNEEFRDKGKSFSYIATDGPQTFRAWGKWDRYDIAAAYNDGCTIRELDCGIQYITGKTSTGFSNMLQGRLRESRFKNSNRSRWLMSLFEKRNRQEERQEAGYFRVESVEILEPGHPRLEKYRDETGIIYFYDFKAKQHPSYSIGGILVHNSSILKGLDGVTRSLVTQFMRKHPYRLLCTATPSPNDYIELGTASEALGELGFMDMITRFFKKPTKSYSRRDEFRPGSYIFRGHSERDFWRWVCSWARAVRKPSDMGFDDNGFVLPPLELRAHSVKANTLPEGWLFDVPAVGLKEQREERRRTITERCEKVAELVSDTGEPAVCWCQLNDEGDLLERLIPGAGQIAGKDSDEKKEELFDAFINGQLRVLISKSVIAGFGVNWQHCAHQTYFPSNSFEQWYQSIRRSWRFGQKNKVVVDMISTEGEKAIIVNLEEKQRKADKMIDNLIAMMNQGLKVAVPTYGTIKEELPSWLTPVKGGL